ncbi:MAG TPA: NUDIX domain-containing protein [Fimbriimonadaceae bacterium]|nr:NUDIX domain-containing protein [Fimbriimonadaceae bacterium]
MASESAGILLYRRASARPGAERELPDDEFEVFLAHPGGPFWAGKDDGAWTIPKGLIEDGEDKLAAAIREFDEETGIRLKGPFVELGSVRLKSGKVVHAWACEGDADPDQVRSNTVEVRWAGKTLTVPEVDRCAWFGPEAAILKINPAQAELILRLARSMIG